MTDSMFLKIMNNAKPFQSIRVVFKSDIPVAASHRKAGVALAKTTGVTTITGVPYSELAGTRVREAEKRAALAAGQPDPSKERAKIFDAEKPDIIFKKISTGELYLCVYPNNRWSNPRKQYHTVDGNGNIIDTFDDISSLVQYLTPANVKKYTGDTFTGMPDMLTLKVANIVDIELI